MKPKYMLDTNICIYLMKKQPVEVRERFAQCFVGDVVISAISLAELEHGVICSEMAESANHAQLVGFLEDVPVASFEALAARAYGPARCSSQECSRDALDKLIASHAIALELLILGSESVYVNTCDFACNVAMLPPAPCPHERAGNSYRYFAALMNWPKDSHHTMTAL